MFVPEDISISEDVLDTASARGTNLTCTLDTSPIQYQIKRKKRVRLGRINKTKTEKKV